MTASPNLGIFPWVSAELYRVAELDRLNALQSEAEVLSVPAYAWQPQPLPGPGAENAAFVAPQRVPMNDIFIGTMPYSGLNILQPPQVFSPLSLSADGLGGLQSGSIYGQAMVDGTNYSAFGE